MTVKIVRSQKLVERAEKGETVHPDYFAPVEYRSARTIGVKKHNDDQVDYLELSLDQGDGLKIIVGLYADDVAYFLENGKTIDMVRA